MYLLKIKGKAKIPDFVQIRDDEFTLISYIKLDNICQGLKKYGLSHLESKIVKLLNEGEFGKIMKII
ncbi:MAG: fructose-6-phosphate aldolase [Bacteroidota bacterium]